MKDLDTLVEELERNKEARCPACDKGMLRPINTNVKVNHYYICDNCGEPLTITPNIIID